MLACDISVDDPVSAGAPAEQLAKPSADMTAKVNTARDGKYDDMKGS